MARKAGFNDVRKVDSRPLKIDNKSVAQKTGNIQFMSTTYRLFKVEGMEEDCEEYGQAVRYRGTIENFPDFFRLDEGHCFETGKMFPVCGNTWLMLEKTRFREHFDFFGDFSNHFGLFPDCGTENTQAALAGNQVSTGTCC